MTGRPQITLLARALAFAACLLAVCPAAASAQESAVVPRRRPAPSLTSEDLLGRRSVYANVQPEAAGIAPPPRAGVNAAGAAASSFYRDPAGAFAINLPGANWRVNRKAAHHAHSRGPRSFHKIDDEGFASASANVFVLAPAADLAAGAAARLTAEEQGRLAATLVARFFSRDASLVSVVPHESGAGLSVVAEEQAARRPAVRAAITAFERAGRLYVVVCSAPAEGFAQHAREFDQIAASLAASR